MSEHDEGKRRDKTMPELVDLFNRGLIEDHTLDVDGAVREEIAKRIEQGRVQERTRLEQELEQEHKLDLDEGQSPGR